MQVVAPTATIANGASLSDEVVLGPRMVASFVMPAAWTAANLTFQGASAPGGTFMDVFDSDGVELTVSAGASRAIGLTATEADILSGFAVIKIRSGTTGTPVAQGAQRLITVILK